MFSVLQGNLAGLYDVPRSLCAMRRAGVASGVDKESAFDCHMVFRKSALSVNKLFTARVGNICVPSDASHASPESLSGSRGGWLSTETFTAGTNTQ